MKIILWQDDTVSLDLGSLAANANRFFGGSLHFVADKRQVKILGDVVKNPDTYHSILKISSVKSATSTADRVFIVTKKPYDNNFFWDSPPGVLSIFSCFGWEDLTRLPLSNGMVYVIAWFAANQIGLRPAERHNEITGCINDFLWDKRGIDVCMRSAYICAECLEQFKTKKLTNTQRQIFDGLKCLLNDLASASRANNDILSYWGYRATDSDFDVFLCHNSEDKEDIRAIANKLTAKNLHPWLDEERIPPGRPWQEELEKSIPKIKSAAVFVGKSGYGPWQKLEIKAFLQEFAERQCPVIPVMLDGFVGSSELPLFMRQFMWVDFRKKHPDPFNQLIWGITGKKPE